MLTSGKTLLLSLDAFGICEMESIVKWLGLVESWRKRVMGAVGLGRLPVEKELGQVSALVWNIGCHFELQ